MEMLSKRKNATAPFTIVRDFPRIVNILTLEEKHTFLNDCAEIITETASKYHGSLTNPIGDRMQTVFADPKTEFDNAQHAVKCASSIQNAAQEIGVKWRHAIDFLVELDIGMSTGEILVGPIGPKRKQHLPVGKNVILAEQLAQLCREYKVQYITRCKHL